MRTIVIAFEYVTGRHTAINIKKQYDSILERFEIADKVFKIVADQAANMKKALQSETESTSIVGGASEDSIINLTKLLIESRKKQDYLQERKQAALAENLNKSIDKINNEFSNKNLENNKQFNREQLLLTDFDDMTESLSANSDEEDADSNDDTKNDEDCDDDEEKENGIEVDPSLLEFVFDSYLPCAAHNGQLVQKDGILLDEAYTKLIKKVSHDIVSKTKNSTLIAEEIRNLEKTLKTYVITRWNSILFMIRSVLKLTVSDFKALANKMNAKTEKQRNIKEAFGLSRVEKAMLVELEALLSIFEWMTNEFQCKLMFLNLII